MSRTVQRSKQSRTPQELAIEAADKYFAAISADLPFDTAPGDVNLIELACEIHDAIRPEGTNTDSEDSALRAGYLLGVQVGIRMAGGAR